MSYSDRVKAAADRVAAKLRELPDWDGKHDLLGDFALVRAWAENAGNEGDRTNAKEDGPDPGRMEDL